MLQAAAVGAGTAKTGFQVPKVSSKLQRTTSSGGAMLRAEGRAGEVPVVMQHLSSKEVDHQSASSEELGLLPSGTASSQFLSARSRTTSGLEQPAVWGGNTAISVSAEVAAPECLPGAGPAVPPAVAVATAPPAAVTAKRPASAAAQVMRQPSSSSLIQSARANSASGHRKRARWQASTGQARGLHGQRQGLARQLARPVPKDAKRVMQTGAHSSAPWVPNSHHVHVLHSFQLSMSGTAQSAQAAQRGLRQKAEDALFTSKSASWPQGAQTAISVAAPCAGADAPMPTKSDAKPAAVVAAVALEAEITGDAACGRAAATNNRHQAAEADVRPGEDVHIFDRPGGGSSRSSEAGEPRPGGAVPSMYTRPPEASCRITRVREPAVVMRQPVLKRR